MGYAMLAVTLEIPHSSIKRNTQSSFQKDIMYQSWSSATFTKRSITKVAKSQAEPSVKLATGSSELIVWFQAL